jgi:hypothetical protein
MDVFPILLVERRRYSFYCFDDELRLHSSLICKLAIVYSQIIMARHKMVGVSFLEVGDSELEKMNEICEILPTF